MSDRKTSRLISPRTVLGEENKIHIAEDPFNLIMEMAGRENRETDFSGENLTGAEYHNWDFTGSNFSDTDLTNASFINCILEKCTFNGTIMKNTRFDRSKFNESTFTNCRIKNSSFKLVRFNRCIINSSFDRCNLSNCVAISADIGNITFKDCDMVGSFFKVKHLKGEDIRTISFINSDLSIMNIKTQEQNTIHVIFTGSKLIGMYLEYLIIKGDMIGNNFTGSSLTACEFKSNTLKTLNFSSCVLNYVTFDGCNMKEILFHLAETDNLNLISSTVENCDFNHLVKESNLGVWKSKLLSCSFLDNKFLTLKATKETILEKCTFKGGTINSVIKNVTLIDSNFSDTELFLKIEESKIKNCNFSNSSFNDTFIRKNIFEGVSFSKIIFFEVNIINNKYKNTTAEEITGEPGDDFGKDDKSVFFPEERLVVIKTKSKKNSSSSS